MNKEEILQGITTLTEDLSKDILAAYKEGGVLFGNERYSSWQKRVVKFLDQHLPNESLIFRNKRTCFGIQEEPYKSPEKSFWEQDGKQMFAYLHSLVLDIENDHYISPNPIKELNSDESDPLSDSALEQVIRICDNFHKIAKQLRVRHSGRQTLVINDEYDVQYLLHSLLHLYFTDIRPEDAVPSNAAKCTRVDFLLKNEGIVIEAKKTRQGLTAKEVSSQLIEDKHRYQSHPDCKTLICFVYDPEGIIHNPRGIEKDLNQNNDDFKVHVLIRPS